MNDVSTLGMFGAIFPIYGLIAMGWFARKLSWIKPEADSSIVKIAVELTLPCFILSNLLDNKRLESVEFSLMTIFLGSMGILISLCCAWVAGRLVGLRLGNGLRTFVVTVGAQNYGFFLIALVAILFANGGGDMMGILITHNVGCDLIYWSLGFLLISNAKKVSFAFLLRGPVWSVFLALFLVWTGISHYIPDFVKTLFKFAGGIAVPLNLMIFGTLLYDMLEREKFSIKILSVAVAMRMFILPACFIICAWLLPIDHTLKILLMLQALSPCGVMSAVLAKHFGGHPKIAVYITLLTCIVAIFTLPLWLNVGISLIGK
jgi:predicted permease